MIRRLQKQYKSFNNLVKNQFAFNPASVRPEYTKLFINNEFVDPIEGGSFETINPATEEVICNVARATEADAEKAVQAAVKAFDIDSEWRHMSYHQRGVLMNRFAQLMEDNIEELAALETLDNGKPYHFSRDVDMYLAIKTMRYYAGWCDKIQGTVQPIEGNHFCYTRREPVGVCGQIIPWNFPALMLAWKWAPCLASGSVTVLKSSEKTPLTALKLAALSKEAGFPDGVINVLSGYGDVGTTLVKHPKVDKIAFTGSTKVGLFIQQNSSIANLKRVTLELGGKSANIVCHDADMDLAVSAAKVGLFLNQGQCCIAGSRVYVHESIYDRFIEEMVEHVGHIKLGDPFADATTQGPQVDKIQFDSVMNYIDIGKKEGARLVLGGERHGDKGYFIQPTIFADVEDHMTISREEIFGPVMQISKFSDYDEVIRRANDSDYGLGAGVITQNTELFQKLSNALRVGTVYVNCYDVFDCNTPFGGFKNSGLGRELGPQGLDNYLESKTVIVKRSPDTLP